MIKLAFTVTKSNFNLSINETLPATGITVIFGRSGAGKTTIINAISGLITPDVGQISLENLDVFNSLKKINLPAEKRNIGYVFQESRLFPHMTVSQNLKYGAKNNFSNLNEIIELLGINSFLNRYPSALSGGEKQRVAIGRALLSQPKLLMMDEPTASLDQPRRQELLKYLRQITSHLSIPLIYITHQIDEVLQLADHLLLIENGKVIANDNLESVWQSDVMLPWFSKKELSSLLIASVREKHPIYPLTALDVSGETIWIPDINSPVGTTMRLRVFASDISISKTKALDTSIRNLLSARIKRIWTDSNTCHVELVIKEQRLIANITQWAVDELDLKPEMQVFAQLKGASIEKKDISQKMAK